MTDENAFDVGHIRLRMVYTLIFIHDKESEQLLIGQKQRGALLGQWNGFGGKVERLETIAESAARELKEEAFISAPLFPIGFIQWVVTSPDQPTYRDVMVVFKAFTFELLDTAAAAAAAASTSSSLTPELVTVHKTLDASSSLQHPLDKGQVSDRKRDRITRFTPSDEMAPAWWDIDHLPWESMRINHKVWYPLMLADRPYRGIYWYETTRASTETTKSEASSSNTQRENAQEIYTEDPKKRRVQFGKNAIQTASRADPVQDLDVDMDLRAYASRIGISGDCYSTLAYTDTKLSEQSTEPVPSSFLDEKWLRETISKLEKEWTL
ncbi:hypothetical protein BGZ99_001247 [Dissophora globulifera]|uniref:Nudix hydrolase domain-containing protein n=1 Tax=Dissophora globulifera TaxID=979702 RepID=A0A9P6UY53_9FUNG|nr:hypothetical protein BGZ99_001247 [Dissophora globulifera]